MDAFTQPIEQLYDLGYHVASGQLVRIPAKRTTGCIPPGCVRVVRYRERVYRPERLTPYWLNPYTLGGTLRPLYWGYPRAQDVEFRRQLEDEKPKPAVLDDAYYDASSGSMRVPEGLQPNPRFIAVDVGSMPCFVDTDLWRRHMEKLPPATPGVTVRSWFRAMRAADFSRDLLPNLAFYGVAGIDVLSDASPRRWTLFDTFLLVDRVTAATYPPQLTDILFVGHEGRVVGWIEDVAFPHGYGFGV